MGDYEILIYGVTAAVSWLFVGFGTAYIVRELRRRKRRKT